LKDIKYKNNIVILGAGGHCASIIGLINRNKVFKIYGILDPNYKKIKKINGYDVIGDDSILTELKNKGINNLAIGIGSKGYHLKRNIIFKKAKKIGFKFPILIDKSVEFPVDAKISEGSQIFSGSIINTNVRIGKICVINTGSIIEHDTFIDDNVFTGPRVTICGAARIEEDVFLGANSCILPEITIRKKSTVGAFTLVNKNFSENSKLIGVPAIKKNDQ